jgi:hypothetical protein
MNGKKIFSISFVLSALLFLNSCFKEDQKIIPHDPGDLKTMTIDLTNLDTKVLYQYQVYFDFASESVISTNDKKSSDLGFECADTGWHVILNTADFMYATNTGSTDFSSPIDTTGMKWHFDKSDGNLDSLAIGNWVTFSGPDSVKTYSNDVYIIDRGYDALGNLLGLKKIVFLSLENGVYTFKYANLDGSDEHTFSIAKNPDVNYVFFSFDDGGKEVDLQPPKYDWDLIFTQYTTLLFTNDGQAYPYLVTGALSNRYGVEVAEDTIMDFNSIDLEKAMNMDFSKDLDLIGYDWKDIVGDPTSGSVTYVIREGVHYVLRNQEGLYFKLRFVAFYNSDGLKGFPKFEFQQL